MSSRQMGAKLLDHFIYLKKAISMMTKQDGE